MRERLTALVLVALVALVGCNEIPTDTGGPSASLQAKIDKIAPDYADGYIDEANFEYILEDPELRAWFVDAFHPAKNGGVFRDGREIWIPMATADWPESPPELLDVDLWWTSGAYDLNDCETIVDEASDTTCYKIRFHSTWQEYQTYPDTTRDDVEIPPDTIWTMTVHVYRPSTHCGGSTSAYQGGARTWGADVAMRSIAWHVSSPQVDGQELFTGYAGNCTRVEAVHYAPHGKKTVRAWNYTPGNYTWSYHSGFDYGGIGGPDCYINISDLPSFAEEYSPCPVDTFAMFGAQYNNGCVCDTTIVTF